jgi:hypothetical protein
MIDAGKGEALWIRLPRLCAAVRALYAARSQHWFARALHLADGTSLESILKPVAHA